MQRNEDLLLEVERLEAAVVGQQRYEQQVTDSGGPLLDVSRCLQIASLQQQCETSLRQYDEAQAQCRQLSSDV